MAPEEILSVTTEMKDEFYLVQNLASVFTWECMPMHILNSQHGLSNVGVYIEALNKRVVETKCTYYMEGTFKVMAMRGETHFFNFLSVGGSDSCINCCIVFLVHSGRTETGLNE